jgi:hypothetical protein
MVLDVRLWNSVPQGPVYLYLRWYNVMKMISVRVVLVNGVEFQFNRYSPKEIVAKELSKMISSGVVEVLDTLIPATSILYIDMVDVRTP